MKLYSSKHVAQLTGFCEGQITRMVKQGRLSAIPHERQKLFDAETIVDYMLSHEITNVMIARKVAKRVEERLAKERDILLSLNRKETIKGEVDNQMAIEMKKAEKIIDQRIAERLSNREELYNTFKDKIDEEVSLRVDKEIDKFYDKVNKLNQKILPIAKIKAILQHSNNRSNYFIEGICCALGGGEKLRRKSFMDCGLEFDKELEDFNDGYRKTCDILSNGDFSELYPVFNEDEDIYSKHYSEDDDASQY